MFGSEFNGEPPARAMGVPPRGAPFVSSEFTEYLPTISCFCLFLLGRPCFCWVRTSLFLVVSAGLISALWSMVDITRCKCTLLDANSSYFPLKRLRVITVISLGHPPAFVILNK